MVWFEDDLSTIRAALTPGFTGQTKHIDVKIKCAREFIERELFVLKYCPSEEQLADVLTKHLRGYQQKAFVDQAMYQV